MDSLFELEEVEEIKDCPRKSNKGIESNNYTNSSSNCSITSKISL